MRVSCHGPNGSVWSSLNSLLSLWSDSQELHGGSGDFWYFVIWLNRDLLEKGCGIRRIGWLCVESRTL